MVNNVEFVETTDSGAKNAKCRVSVNLEDGTMETAENILGMIQYEGIMGEHEPMKDYLVRKDKNGVTVNLRLDNRDQAIRWCNMLKKTKA